MLLLFILAGSAWSFGFSVQAEEVTDANLVVDHADVEIHDGDVVKTEDFSELSHYWVFSFDWPVKVDNNRSFLGVFRGEFGALEGGDPALHVNYLSTTQGWGSKRRNHFAKPMGQGTYEAGNTIGTLGHASTSPGNYTILIAERNGDFETHPNNELVEWFASGGMEGIAPVRYAMITFTLGEVEQRIDPVIVVPGILGSTYKNGEWMIDPIFHVYDDLLATLEANGYTRGEDLFTLPYNWRQSNELTAIELKHKLQEVQEICECAKVDVVAHSMGGLVARSLIQGPSYEDNIDQLIFLGTPHLGAPKAYLMWEGGEFPTGVEDWFLERHLLKEAKKKGYNSLLDYIRTEPIISVQQLLPVYDYLKDINVGALREYPQGYPTNSFLEDLLATKNTIDNSGVEIHNVISNTSTSTIGAIEVGDAGGGTLWEHGEPVNFVGTEGDATVPSSSASLFNNNLKNIDAIHIRLPTNAEGFVYETLTNKKPNTLIDRWGLGRITMIFIRVFSPVDIVVTSPDGKKIGKNFETGEEINEIPYAFYSGFETDDEYITILNPLDGEYVVEVEGTGKGKYTIASSYFSDGVSADTEVTDITFSGEINTFVVEVSSANPEESLIEQEEVTLAEIIKKCERCIKRGGLRVGGLPLALARGFAH